MTLGLTDIGAVPASEFDSRGLARSVSLRGREGIIRAFAVVDPDDYGWASGVSWYLAKGKHRRIGYAVRTVRVDGKSKKEFLHRAVVGLERRDEREVDHKSRMPLDNRKSNLRIVSHAANGQNLPPIGRGSSKFRGVSFRKDLEKWQAYLRIEGKQHHIGYFESEQEAADAAASFRKNHMPYSEEASV